MSTVDKLLWYMFVLSAILIVAVYFVGVSTDAGALKDFFVSIFNTVTGRPPGGGAFGGYPSSGSGGGGGGGAVNTAGVGTAIRKG